MSHATHANAALTPRARLRLAQLVVDHGWSPARAAERYDVSWRTAKKWSDRYAAEGRAGMAEWHVPVKCPAGSERGKAVFDKFAGVLHARIPFHYFNLFLRQAVELVD